MTENVHIFWDNTNIFLGAVDTAALVEPNVPRYAIRVYWKNLYNLVVDNRPALTKEMAGYVPPQAADLWRYAEQMGFQTTLLRRVANGFGILREQAVDEILHLRIANTILARPKPETIALLSGDGRESHTGTSFPGQLRFALLRDWKVEVYSWESALNTFKYNALQEEFPDLVKIVGLDNYYQALTFVKEGVFYEYSPSGEKREIIVPARVVKSL